MKYVLVIDQGTTSSRAILFDSKGNQLSSCQLEVATYFPHSGWVEQDPDEIWCSVVSCCRKVLENVSLNNVVGIGISNQRETTIVWDRQTGKPCYHAIIWQDRRTAEFCASLKAMNHEPTIAEKTGLLLDPYFSASKLNWILQQDQAFRRQAEKGDLLFGTVDCFLLWHLTKGEVHATDMTNAARTLLFNINTKTWDEDLLQLFSIPRAMLPEVKENCGLFGTTSPELFGQALPVLAMMGDQQAALMGQQCLNKDEAKCTYGTGCFLVINTGESRLAAQPGLLQTIASVIQGKTHYAIEGSIFAAGTIIKWLRDGLKLITTASESEQCARAISDNGGVYLVPAFTGLGAPYWNPNVRGALFGLTRSTESRHIVRAGLEAIAYQTKDLLQGYDLSALNVDGGVTANSWLMQFLADILQTKIVVSQMAEATALGIAYLVILGAGLIQTVGEIKTFPKISTNYLPEMSLAQAEYLYDGWKQAVHTLL